MSGGGIMRALLLLALILVLPSNGFSFTTSNTVNLKTVAVHNPATTMSRYTLARTLYTHTSPTLTVLQMAYIPPEDAEKAKTTKPKLPQPKIGDVVRYFDMDGGLAEGQVLVGKISLIQPIRSEPTSEDGTNKWLVEINEMEDVGDGYYADYPSRKRRKCALRKLEEIAPVPASFVRTEDAYKIPVERGTNRPLPSHASYDLIGYEGPAAVPINQDVVKTDGEKYGKIKSDLIRNSAIAGAAGAIVAQLVSGSNIALIYAAGAFAGVAYLFFLGIKTDTVGSEDAKLGSNVSNLRFVFPGLVLVGVALNNKMSGDSNPVSTPGMFSTVTPQQFGAAMAGFLTYRVPLLVSQLSPVISESAADMVPGSAGMAMRLAQDAKNRGVDMSLLEDKAAKDGLTTVFLVSGPEATGKTTLVNKLLESDSRFVKPALVDKIADAVKFERLQQRGAFLEVDQSGRYGLAKEGVLEAAGQPSDSENGEKKVVVVDADVELAKKMVNVSGARLVGVWIGLDDLDKFESRLKTKISSGMVPIPEDETEDTVLRAKIRQVVKDIEFGVVSGVFEFTILNEDVDDSFKQLKDAASYCFK
uniref:Guanylate kinase-like domain-containing protein n=1 Tax=Skeletonema marinoi TaxID=267567 RepID=A0A7S1CRS6_9STRA|mmetsp:Transcript_27883/g.43077  ORF Transcript_27883/g.43077 Transcript_27883/m.43077 type:complete len:586 (-) Transcript_27883:46-1803(-)